MTAGATAPIRDVGVRQRLSIPDWLPWPALSLGLLITIAISTLLWTRMAAVDEQRFQSEVDKVVAQMRRRMVAHEEILRGAAGLVRGSEQVTREEWRDYVEELNLPRNYPGILGVGLTVRMSAADKAAHEASVRKDVPDYRIRPDTPRDEYHSILYLHPLNALNLRAIGYDMNSEPTRSAAMSLARYRRRCAVRQGHPGTGRQGRRAARLPAVLPAVRPRHADRQRGGTAARAGGLHLQPLPRARSAGQYAARLRRPGGGERARRP